MPRFHTAFIAPLALSLACAALPMSAQAATGLRVKCEVRADRSTASVDGTGLAAGDYVAVLSSGDNTASADPLPSVAGEVEFDFSSRPRDIKAGATELSATFIQGGRVTGALYTAQGQLLATASKTCKVK